MSKRVLVTGGTGFVGANLARRLLADGHEVHLALRRGYTRWRIEDIIDRLRLHTVDLADPYATRALLATVHADWIFHLAVYGAYPQQVDTLQMVRTNISGTIALVDAALDAGVEAFVNTGTSSEYGFKDHAPSEDEALEPNSAYAVTKAAATMYCHYLASKARAPIVTLRLYSAFGPFEEPSRLLPQLLIKSRANRLPSLVDPEVARDYVYVDDVTDAYLRATRVAQEHSGSTYNIGTGVQTSLRQVVEIVRRLRHIDVEPEWGSMPRRPWDTTSWIANITRAQAQLGWRPHVTLAAGIERMAAWLDAESRLDRRYQEAEA